MENGGNFSCLTLIKVLRTLESLEALEAFLPAPESARSNWQKCREKRECGHRDNTTKELNMASEYQVAEVNIWGHKVGAFAWNAARNAGEFEFDPAFVKLGLELSPLQMPLRRSGEIFSFPELNPKTYFGLPGMLADALPDRWGNQLIDQWLAEHGRSGDDFSPIERLCYMGKRATGALEFNPVLHGAADRSAKVEINHLVELARDAPKHRNDLSIDLSAGKTKAIQEILRVGNMAGGARAKAVLAINPVTGEISGPVKLTPATALNIGLSNSTESPTRN